MSISTSKETSMGLSKKSRSSSSSLSSIAFKNANFFGSSAILPTFSSASKAFRILANSRCLRLRRASPSSSDSDRSKSAPRLRRRPPLLISLKSFSTAFSSLARSLLLFDNQYRFILECAVERIWLTHKARPIGLHQRQCRHGPLSP